MALTGFAEILDAETDARPSPMSAPIQQSGRSRKISGQGPAKTGAVLRGIHRAFHWLRLGTHSVSTGAIYFEVSRLKRLRLLTIYVIVPQLKLGY